jgi:hypothetical protein
LASIENRYRVILEAVDEALWYLFIITLLRKNDGRKRFSKMATRKSKRTF